MTGSNDVKDREFPTTPSERGAVSKVESFALELDETELDETRLDGTIDPWQDQFEQSLPDRRDIDGELLEGRMLVELFGGEAPEVAIGQYLIERRLGHGGMGEVYAGRDILAGHEVAIKLLRPTDDVELDRKRLIGEARALARVKHPNVIALYHIGEHQGRLFIVMERIEGRTLARWQMEEKPRLPALLRVYAAAARGLAAAHRAGVVHGDFKPSNVLLADDGRVLVSDFGVASVSEDAGELAARSAHQRSNRGGTVLYLSPERAVGEDGDPRSDQFSFFAALFQAIHGVGPVPGSSRAELLSNLCEGRLVLAPRSRRRVPSWLERAFERGLSLDPRGRFAGMDEVAALLERKLSRRMLYVAGSIGAAALLLAIGRASAPEAPIEVDPLADAWSDQQRQVIESNPALAGPQLVTALDGWADQWRSVAEHYGQDPDTRGCLAASLDRFDTLVDRLAAGGVSNRVAFLAAGELPDPRWCVIDPAAPPEHLADHERKTIAANIGEAELARLDLRFADAIHLASLALDQARRSDWLGAELDALEQIGLALGDQRDRFGALARLEEARRLAVRAGKFERAAELGVELALAVGPDIGEARRLDLLTWAEDLVAGMGEQANPRLRAQLALARANEQLRQRAFVEAEATLDAAIARIDLDPLAP
ncbi:MAG TPA: serine/threonine-protein kinase, partial [Enhygromyxa sp.]|nr:serine/threonine-protein kinase [Enhygromyxa sp.]